MWLEQSKPGGAAGGQMRGRQGPDHEESKRRASPARTAKAQKELRMHSDIVEHAGHWKEKSWLQYLGLLLPNV